MDTDVDLEVEVEDSFNDNSDNSTNVDVDINDSFNTDNSTDDDIVDSFNKSWDNSVRNQDSFNVTSSFNTQTLNEANAYTDQRISEIALGGWNDDFNALRMQMDDRFRQQDRRIDRMGAMGSAMTHMAVNAANGSAGKGRVAVGVGAQGGERAVSIGYGKRVGSRASFSLGASFSSGESTVGGGFGFDL